ncbi:MAG: hypothetical protein H6506_01880 [Calditrichaeota bacterium]|nr:hypothetical protein [Calditrichota bacterium]MCB9391381.1 hypothetical protein [Calditrichota bacterium]
MQADITREIVLDLVPGYLAGDASPETRALVERYAQADPYIRRVLDAGESFQDTLSPKIQTPDMEMETLKHTRSCVQRQVIFLALGIAGTMLAVSFGWGGTFLAAGFWILYFLRREKMNDLLFK